jgi:hypothetical protein
VRHDWLTHSELAANLYFNFALPAKFQDSQRFSRESESAFAGTEGGFVFDPHVDDAYLRTWREMKCEALGRWRGIHAK